MATKKYLDYEGLGDVASHVNTRLKTVTVMPLTAKEGAVRLYVGTSTTEFKKGHAYQWNTSAWVDITDDTPHVTGTYNEIQSAISSDGIPDGAYVGITDDYEDNLGMPIKDVSSAAGVTTATLREFIKGMLSDIAMQTWENGSYAGKFQSTHAGGGDFGGWIGSYQCTKSHSSAYGTTVIGVANNKGFTAIWAGGAVGWDVKMCGYQQKFDEWTNLGTYQGSSLTIPANSASWVKIVGAYIDLGKDTFVPRFFANDIVITNWSIDPADSTLIVLCRNFSAVDITLQKVWLTVIRN